MVFKVFECLQFDLQEPSSIIIEVTRSLTTVKLYKELLHRFYRGGGKKKALLGKGTFPTLLGLVFLNSQESKPGKSQRIFPGCHETAQYIFLQCFN